MTKTGAEIKFEKARKRLSKALQSLEDVIKKKLHQEAIESRMIGATSDVEVKIIEQNSMIQNLTLEVNSLQQALSDLGRDTEFLNTKNKIFAEKLAIIRQKQLQFIEAIESDLVKISAAIKTEEDL